MAQIKGLYAVTPDLADTALLVAKVEVVLAAGTRWLQYRNKSINDGVRREQAEALRDLCRRHGATLIINDDVALACTLDADGVHVRGQGEQLEEVLDEAIETLKPDRIVGAGGVKTRHDSMTVGELEVDYVMFGDPSPDGWTPLLETVIERVSWWTEIFTVACVGFATKLEDVRAISEAGADFVALGEAVWNDARGPGAAVAEAQAALVRGAPL